MGADAPKLVCGAPPGAYGRMGGLVASGRTGWGVYGITGATNAPELFCKFPVGKDGGLLGRILLLGGTNGAGAPVAPKGIS